MTTTNSNVMKWSAAAAVLLALGAAGGYWWAHRSMPNTQSTSTAERKVLYWHDPMVPGQKFDKPGKSPFMDMDLVPVYADEEGGGDVRINPSVVQNLGIRLGKVEKVAMNTRLRAVGSVAFDERLLELVQSRVEGYVTRLHVKTPLERVRRGQPLADILAPQWLEAEQEYLTLLDASSARAQTLRDAARQRLVVLGVPEAAIRMLETRRKTSANTTVIAPIDGVITELGVREGAAFMSGVTLFRINGLSTVWANAQIPEARVSSVPIGSTVEAHTTAWPGLPFKGEVIGLLPEVDPQTRTLTARIALKNPERKLSPGMFVTLDFTAPATEPQLVIPSEALIETGERTAVIVARGDGGFDVVNVSVGSDQDGRTVILSGLKEGQSIVLSGQFLIDSEASLKSTVGRLQGVEKNVLTAMKEAEPELHTAQGVIKAIGGGEITIEHGPVPSLGWGEMTMPFKLPAGGLPKDVEIGKHVNFSFFATEAHGFQIDGINTLDSSTQSARP